MSNVYSLMVAQHLGTQYYTCDRGTNTFMIPYNNILCMWDFILTKTLHSTNQWSLLLPNMKEILITYL